MPAVSLITGAGTGIGRATAMLLAAQGHLVALSGRTRTKLEGVVQEIESLAHSRGAARDFSQWPRNSLIVEGTLGDPDLAYAIVERVQAELGPIDNLINNAGTMPSASMSATTPQLVRETMRNNAFSAADLTLACWAGFCQRKSGCIINISSKAAFDPFPGFFAYAASKAAMDSYMRSAAVEARGLGIRCFALDVGLAETASMRTLFDTRQAPPANCLSPDEVARIVLDCIEGRRAEDEGRAVVIDTESLR
ncbi:MAG: SDR family oxidoreductase [Phycisphaerales bacterium]|nr:SDR family oxidoreductase [Phycisphaerales bacterium]